MLEWKFAAGATSVSSIPYSHRIGDYPKGNEIHTKLVHTAPALQGCNVCAAHHVVGFQLPLAQDSLTNAKTWWLW